MTLNRKALVTKLSCWLTAIIALVAVAMFCAGCKKTVADTTGPQLVPTVTPTPNPGLTACDVRGVMIQSTNRPDFEVPRGGKIELRAVPVPSLPAACADQVPAQIRWLPGVASQPVHLPLGACTIRGSAQQWTATLDCDTAGDFGITVEATRSNGTKVSDDVVIDVVG